MALPAVAPFSQVRFFAWKGYRVKVEYPGGRRAGMWTPAWVSGHISPNLERQGRIALTLSLFRRASLVNRITANRRLGAASFRRVLRWRVLLRSPRAWTATRPRPEGPAHAFLPGQCRKGTPALPISVELKRCALISSLIRRASGFRGGKR